MADTWGRSVNRAGQILALTSDQFSKLGDGARPRRQSGVQVLPPPARTETPQRVEAHRRPQGWSQEPRLGEGSSSCCGRPAPNPRGGHATSTDWGRGPGWGRALWLWEPGPRTGAETRREVQTGDSSGRRGEPLASARPSSAAKSAGRALQGVRLRFRARPVCRARSRVPWSAPGDCERGVGVAELPANFIRQVLGVRGQLCTGAFPPGGERGQRADTATSFAEGALQGRCAPAALAAGVARCPACPGLPRATPPPATPGLLLSLSFGRPQTLSAEGPRRTPALAAPPPAAPGPGNFRPRPRLRPSRPRALLPSLHNRPPTWRCSPSHPPSRPATKLWEKKGPSRPPPPSGIAGSAQRALPSPLTSWDCRAVRAVRDLEKGGVD